MFISFFSFLSVKVASFHSKKTAAEKAYVSALCKILVSLHFRLSEQGPIKIMRKLLCRMAECVSSEKDLVKELKRMADHLMTIDRQQDQELLQEEVNLILGNALYFFFDIVCNDYMPRLWFLLWSYYYD